MPIEAEDNLPARRYTPNEDATSISDIEYFEAIRGIASFVDIDVAKIFSYEELLKKISHMGSDLRTVLLAGIKVANKPLAERKIGIAEYTDETSFDVIALPDKVNIRIFQPGDPRLSKTKMSVTLPVGDIADPDKAAKFRTLLEAKEGLQAYKPLLLPQHSNHSQGFARVLQSSLRQIIPYLPQRIPGVS